MSSLSEISVTSLKSDWAFHRWIDNLENSILSRSIREPTMHSFPFLEINDREIEHVGEHSHNQDSGCQNSTQRGELTKWLVRRLGLRRGRRQWRSQFRLGNIKRLFDWDTRRSGMPRPWWVCLVFVSSARILPRKVSDYFHQVVFLFVHGHNVHPATFQLWLDWYRETIWRQTGGIQCEY